MANLILIRAVYLGAMLTSFALFLLGARQLIGFLPWGNLEFGVTFSVGMVAFFVGAALEDKTIWKGRLDGGGRGHGLLRPVLPMPISFGATVGIIGALYV